MIHDVQNNNENAIFSHSITMMMVMTKMVLMMMMIRKGMPMNMKKMIR